METIVQTFLPYADFAACAATLDRQRLGKQRVECLQIINALTNPDAKGWVNHPATRMWRDHLPVLAAYCVAMCDRWIACGYKDTIRDRVLPLADFDAPMPSFIGNEAFHSSHRSNLLRKAPEHYGQFGWTDDPNAEYVWPS